MKPISSFLATLLWLSVVSNSSGQEMKAANPAAAPPKLLVLVQQEVQLGKTTERQKLLATISRACDRFDAPSYWIDLQSLTGTRESLTFDPFDTFEQLQQANGGWRQFFAAHPDLAETQRGIDSLLASERTLIAVRRDDLGAPPAEDIDLSEARFMRVVEVRLLPGHRRDFEETIKLWGEAHTKAKGEVPWFVYRVNEGTSTPTFLVFLPLSELKEYDDLLEQREEVLEENEGEDLADRLRQTAREAYASIESNLYAVHPETSHVAKDFAAGEAGFWKAASPGEAKPEGKPSVSHLKKKP